MERGSSRSPSLTSSHQQYLHSQLSSDSLRCQKFNNHLQGHSQNNNNNNMTFDWTSAPRQRDRLDYHPQKQQHQRWSTYTADTSSTALESGSEDFSFSSARKGDRKLSCSGGDDSVTLLDASMERNQSPSPSLSPLPSAEDTLNTAIESMLSTANSLLISTMTARSDLARLQMMGSVVDQHLDRREEVVLMEIANNNKMIKWMEQASEKLDRVLAESSFNFKTTETVSSTNSSAAWHRPEPSRAASRHWRALSTTGQIDFNNGDSSLGIFDAKDENSTISKTAAKRLEKVLKRSSNLSHTRTDSNATSPDLASRFGMAPANGTALASTIAAAASSSLAAANIVSATSSETSEFRQRTPSITSESGPSSLVSSREENSLSSLPQALLNPQAPYEELPQQLSIVENSSRHAGLGKRSISSLKSPNPIKASRHLSSAGIPNVSEAALGGLNWQEDQDSSLSSESQLLGSKGALESLRKLNGGSSFLQTSSQQNSSLLPGWGGTFASWVGMSSPGA